MKLFSPEELMKKCPVKWHENIPKGGISLGVADVDYEGPHGINEYIKSQLSEDFSFYQNSRGLPSTIETIINYLRTLNIQAKPNNIQVTPGTMMGIYAAMKYISRREGNIVYAGPLYEPIHRHGTDNNNSIQFVPINNNGLDHEVLKKTINENTKMIAINNPSNPIGYVYSFDDLKLIRDLCVDLNIICFSDELYQPLIFNRSKNKHISPITLDGMAERTIALYGFSKAYGLAGYRSGFMYIGDIVTEEINFIIKSQIVSPSPISSIVATWALESSSSKKWVEEFRMMMEERTKFATDLFNQNDIPCELPDSCFFVYPEIATDDILFCERLLNNQEVQAVPGSYFYPEKKNIRINCATGENRLKDGIIRIIAELNNI